MKVLIIPDTHFPYHNAAALTKILAAIRKEKPDVVIQIGDLLDLYTFSKYTKSSTVTPEEEIERGIELATAMWKSIRKAVPRARCYQLLGNHDVRLNKRILERLPELETLFGTGSIYKFEGVKALKSDRDYLELDGVVYVHGWLTKLGDHSSYFGQSVVHGHSHRPGLVIQRKKSGYIFELDVGHLADTSSLPLSYTQSSFSKWSLAYGVVENGHPRLVILEKWAE